MNLDRDRLRTARSDADGVATYVSLIPGAPYRLQGREFTAEAGKSTELDVVVGKDGE